MEETPMTKDKRIKVQREKWLERIKKHLQAAVDLCDEAENHFSDTYGGESFVDFDLKNSIECALEVCTLFLVR